MRPEIVEDEHFLYAVRSYGFHELFRRYVQSKLIDYFITLLQVDGQSVGVDVFCGHLPVFAAGPIPSRQAELPFVEVGYDDRLIAA